MGAEPMIRKSLVGLAAAAALAFAASVGSAAAQQSFTPEFTAATNAEPDSLDLALARDPPAAYVTLFNVYEYPWGFDKNGNVEKTVADWTESEDGKTITLKLHQGVKFQSGDELTADDVIFSWRRNMAKAPFFHRHGDLIADIQALDKYTVKFTFKRPDVDFFDNGGVSLVSKAYFDRVGEKAFVARPVGIGPYAIVDFKPGQYIDLKRFDGYYGKKPAVASARIFFVKDDNTRVAKLKAGEVSIITATPYNDVKSLDSSGFHTVGVDAHPTISVQFNLLNPTVPWYKEKVRLAIAHAIDSQAIIKNLFAGIPKHYAWLAPGEWGYDPSMKPYGYDPKLAKKLLAEAGYPNGFTMPLYYTNDYYGVKQTTEAVVLYLQQVGIKAEVKPISQIDILQMFAKNRDRHDLSYVGVVALPVANVGANPLEMLDLAYWSKQIFRIMKFPALDNDIEQALATLDEAKRKKLVMDGVRVLHEQVAAIPVWDTVYEYTMKKGVNFTPIKHRLVSLRLADVTVNGGGK
jgi:peptide/nickel transport system substrate-binding protein